jgi:hypothetical protein
MVGMPGPADSQIKQQPHGGRFVAVWSIVAPQWSRSFDITTNNCHLIRSGECNLITSCIMNRLYNQTQISWLSKRSRKGLTNGFNWWEVDERTALCVHWSLGIPMLKLTWHWIWTRVSRSPHSYCVSYSAHIQAYLGYYVASKLRFFTPGPIQGISCRGSYYLAERCLLLNITNRYFILREWVHQYNGRGRGAIDLVYRGSPLLVQRQACMDQRQ